jgi:hypothetical protein
MSEGAVAGDEYAKLIGETLDEERKRKESVESRGLQILTTSGGLVTLLIALSKLAGIEVVDGLAKSLIFLALAGFVGAAIGGLLANQPATYQEVSTADLERLVASEEYWAADHGIGSRRAAEVEVAVLVSARAANAKKANLVYLAMAIEVIAIGLLAAGLGYAVERPLA